jgi:hypothetical protein
MWASYPCPMASGRCAAAFDTRQVSSASRRDRDSFFSAPYSRARSGGRSRRRGDRSPGGIVRQSGFTGTGRDQRQSGSPVQRYRRGDPSVYLGLPHVQWLRAVARAYSRFRCREEEVGVPRHPEDAPRYGGKLMQACSSPHRYAQSGVRYAPPVVPRGARVGRIRGVDSAARGVSDRVTAIKPHTFVCAYGLGRTISSRCTFLRRAFRRLSRSRPSHLAYS